MEIGSDFMVWYGGMVYQKSVLRHSLPRWEANIQESSYQTLAASSLAQKRDAPNVGIEPTTTRLRVVRSTD
jgi:hypothetical protein